MQVDSCEGGSDDGEEVEDGLINGCCDTEVAGFPPDVPQMDGVMDISASKTSDISISDLSPPSSQGSARFKRNLARFEQLQALTNEPWDPDEPVSVYYSLWS